MTDTVIRTQRLELRKPHAGDLDRCAELLGDYEVARMLSQVPHPYDLDKGRAFLSGAVRSWKNWPAAPEISFMIQHEGELIGGVSFKALHETPEIGYWLGRSYWGRGFISEAIGAAIAWLFRNTEHEILLGMAMEENARSIKAMAKCGFEAVGRGASLSLARGDYVPDVVMKLTRNAFAEMQMA
jgi:RimJ/RimL family protein N-acetyltransferase